MARKIRKTLKSGGRKLNKKKVNKRTQKKQKGGIKKAPGGIGIGYWWRGKERNLYTYEDDKIGKSKYIEVSPLPSQSQSQGTEGSTNTISGMDIITLEEFGKDDTFEKIETKLTNNIPYIFVVVVEKNPDERSGYANMYLGHITYNHDELSQDDYAKNWILAAGELWMVLGENGEKKLIINNKSGHYRPDMVDVENVTKDFFNFFEKKVEIEFQPYNEMRSPSVSPLSSQDSSQNLSQGSYGGKRSRKNKKSRKVKIIRR
jgi:hypothetical protein